MIFIGIAPSDKMFLYSSAQVRFVTDKLGYPAERSVLTPFMVDTTFFTPSNVARSTRPVICSAGLEFRDYPTIVDGETGLYVAPGARLASEVGAALGPDH